MADRRVYEAQFQLGAKVQASLGKGFGAAQKNLKALQAQAKMNEKAFAGMSNAIRKAAGIAAGYFSLRAISNYMKASIEAGQQELDAQAKLATIMKQRMKATDAQVESIIKLAAAEQRLGIVGDETVVAGAQQLASYLKQQESLEMLIPAMNHLIAQQKGVNHTQQDAVNIANMMGKVFTGQVGALRRVGIAFTAAQERILKYGSEQQKAATLAQVIRDNFGEMNYELLKTDYGQLQWARNELSTIQEELGAKLLPVYARWAKLQVKFMPHILRLFDVLEKIPPVVDKIGVGVDWVMENWDKFAPVIEAVTVALVANKVATLSLAAAQKVGLVIQKLSAGYKTASAALALLREGNSLAAVAQAALNGTMLACPATWVVAGIMAIVMAGYYLIKNWEKVKNFFISLWEKIKPIFEAVGNFFGKIFGGGGKTATVEVKQYAMGAPGPETSSSSSPRTSPSPRPAPYMSGVPQYAAGTRFHPGGPAIINEKGPELINLPRGSSVTPADRTKQLLSGLSSGRLPSITFAPQYTIQGNADEEVIRQVNREAFREFERMFDELTGRRRRLQFA